MRSLLHRSGYRFRKDLPIPGLSIRVRPHLEFTRWRLAVFIDGCFWHRCPLHGSSPHSNAAYWSKKLTQNVARDRAADEHLREAGWTVLRIWEHVPPEEAVRQIIDLIEASRVPLGVMSPPNFLDCLELIVMLSDPEW